MYSDVPPALSTDTGNGIAAPACTTSTTPTSVDPDWIRLQNHKIYTNCHKESTIKYYYTANHRLSPEIGRAHV